MVSENSGIASATETLNEDFSLQTLRAELARIDVLIQRAVRLWQIASQDPSDTFRGLYVSDAEAVHLMQRPFASNWGETVALPPVEEQAFRQAEQQAVLQTRAIQRGQPTRLQGLVEAFGLDPFEKDILLICLAPALDLRYEKIFGYLQDDVTRKRPGINLVLDLCCAQGLDRLQAFSHFATDAPLFRYHLLERFSEPGQNKSSILSQSLLVDETILHWLLGTYKPAAEMAPCLRFTPAKIRTGSTNTTDDEDERYPVKILDQKPVFIFTGPDRLAQQSEATKISQHSKQSLLTVDLAAVSKDEIGLGQAIGASLRDARLTGSLLFLQGWDACLEDGVPATGVWSALAQHPGIVILAGHAAWRPSGLPDSRPVHWREFPIPAYDERKTLWETYLPQTDISTDSDLTTLARQFALTAEQIRDAVLLAANYASQHGVSLSKEDLMAAARTASSSRLSGLARKVPARYAWDDIVLPPDQISLLQEIVFTVRGRSIVLEEWGVGQKLASSYGVSILFAGPPGTGKTMSAQIIAAELGLDLYKIDLSTIVSKYIGETEKNLERIFSEAESSNAILFFDEADALFGKRSEVRDSHDRYANVEISYLLQRMEAYDGVTILATNLRSNLDEAFTRRLQFAVDFPFPEEADRLRIWQSLFPPEVPRATDLDLPLLAQRFKLAGGNIRNIIVSAAYLASANGGVVTMEHLLHGTRRELQKMGRLISDEKPQTR
jgi:AAA+ superfamily predicted ATPase